MVEIASPAHAIARDCVQVCADLCGVYGRCGAPCCARGAHAAPSADQCADPRADFRPNTHANARTHAPTPAASTSCQGKCLAAAPPFLA
eukprot:6214772-Pleurochrysis_carterae.AAC.9